MKKIAAFIGSSQKHATFKAVQEFEQHLKTYVAIEFEYIFFKDYNLEYCNGCKLCFDKGEECCPFKDDRDILIDKIESSDGVIFATPNYAFHVSARMKNFLDRIAFIFHRPRYFGKTFMPIVTQGIYGGNAILKYLNRIGQNFGFFTVKGCCLRTLEPETENQKKKNSKKIKKAAARFYNQFKKSSLAEPSFIKLIQFRISRSIIGLKLNEQYKDYRYYKENSWFDSGYYYDVPLSFLKKSVGNLFDALSTSLAKNR